MNGQMLISSTQLLKLINIPQTLQTIRSLIRKVLALPWCL